PSRADEPAGCCESTQVASLRPGEQSIRPDSRSLGSRTCAILRPDFASAPGRSRTNAMFETSRRPHPLHTFRFWFVIVAAGAVTLAWKLDLLPFRVGPAETGRLSPEAFTDVDSSEDSASADASEQVALLTDS